MAVQIEITEEQHQQAIASAAGLETLLNDVCAKVEQEFWRRSHTTILLMIGENLPFLKAVDVHLEANPHLKGFDFVGACFMCKNKNPNRTPAEIIAEAEQMIGKKGE